MRGWDIIDPNTRKIVVASCSGQPGQQLECIRARILWVRGKWEPIRGRLERGGPIRGRHSGPLLGAEEDRKWKCDSWTRKETLRVIQQLLFCPSPASRSSPSLFTRVFRSCPTIWYNSHAFISTQFISWWSFIHRRFVGLMLYCAWSQEKSS